MFFLQEFDIVNFTEKGKDAQIKNTAAKRCSGVLTRM
jgi:hypothetical protein